MLLTRSALFASPLGERVALYSMTGRETLSQPFTYEVQLLSADDSLDLSELLGQHATVVLERTDGTLRQFTGFVTQFALTGELGNFSRYQATLRPWLWFLGQTRSSRMFQEMTVPEIVMELFRFHGFSDFSDTLSVEYRKWDYLVQYRESDLNFVQRLLEQEGIYFYFKHEDNKHTLVLADAGSAHEDTPGYEEVPYFPPARLERRQEEHIDSWSATRQIRQGLVSVIDFNFEKPSAFLGSQSTGALGHAHGEYDIYDYPGGFKDSAEAEVQAKVRLEEHQADFETMHGAGPVRGLQAGSRFALSRFPRDDQNREYFITSAGYDIRVAEFESNQVKEDAEPLFRFHLQAIDGKRPYRAPRLTRKPRVEGPQTAIVVGDPNQEIWTDQYGRVKVQFHWDREGQRDQNSSCWVRVSQAWAGQNWGSIHIPRIGQEVIVDFLEGDPDRPIITGRVYNADNMPPYGLPDNQTQSGIKSRSSKGGSPDNFNEIRFEDKKGEEELHVQAEKDMSTLVKHNRTTTIGRNDTLNITGDQIIHIHGNLSMTVDGVTDKDNPDKSKPVKSSLGVTGAHRIDASDTIDIQAPNKITLTCGDSVITMVPGKITLTTAGSTVAIDANVFAQSSGQTNLMLDANAFVKSSGGASMLLDANACTQSSGGSQLLLDGDANLTSSGNVGLKGAKVTGKGDTEAGLDGGGSVVTLTPASADLSGAQVNVSGKGVVSIGGPMVKIG